MNLWQEISSFQLFDNDDHIRNHLIPKLKPLFMEKDITQQQLFNAFYKNYLTTKIDYEQITHFFEEMIMNQKIRSGREQYLLAHWLYYQAFKVKEDLPQDETMRLIKSILEKKERPEKTVNSIANCVSFNNKSEKFKQNLKKSQAYTYFEKELSPAKLSQLKITQKHDQLVFILQKMSKFGSSVQFQLQKHIFVSFGKFYKKNSELGQRYQKQLIQLPTLKKTINNQSRMNDRMRRKFDELQVAQDDYDRYLCLQGIKSELISLDVFLLDYLIFQAKENSPKDDSEPRNVDLLVGPTGSGKTTIILKVLGYQLKWTQIQNLRTLQPINLRPQHSALRTSPESTSTTRFMFSAKIPRSSFPAGPYQARQICDSPGFEDSGGCEVDISNSISIQTFIRSCASIKLVVVISQRKVGEKMEGIREIAKIVSNLVADYREIEQKVLIVLNKFEDQNEIQRLKPGVDSILNNLSPAEISDTKYVSFLESLSKKLKRKDVIHFNPFQSDIQDLVSQMKEDRIMAPSYIFKYSLSTKSRNCIANRKILLVRLIKESIGKNNHLAFYYLNQLALFNQCLNNPEIQQEIQVLKREIKSIVSQKTNVAQRKVNEIQSNDSNTNTFAQITKIKEQIKSFQIFAQSIKQIVTVSKFQLILVERARRMIQEINNFQFTKDCIKQQKKKIVNLIKFLQNIDRKLQNKIFQILQVRYQSNIQEVYQLLKDKKYGQIRSITIKIWNLFKTIQQVKELMINVPINLEQQDKSNKKLLQVLIKKIQQQFSLIVKQSTAFIVNFKDNPSITAQTILKINNSIQIFEEIKLEKPILNEIQPKAYKDQIIDNICAFAIGLIERITQIIDSNDNSNINNTNQINWLKNNKLNILKLKEINEVYQKIESKIVRLWDNFSRFIETETTCLNEFLNQLKDNKRINRKTLKKFSFMIRRIIEFAADDNNFCQSINKLNCQIKMSLVKHIQDLKQFFDKKKISLFLRRTLEPSLFQKFKEIEAFYLVKQLKQHISKKIQNFENSQFQEDELEYEDIDMDISQNIESIFQSIIEKILNPFQQIRDQSRKVNINQRITSSYLLLLNDFLQYKKAFMYYKVHQNKNVQKLMAKLQSPKQETIDYYTEQIINNKKNYINQIYTKALQQQKKQLYELSIDQIKQFNKIIINLFAAKKHSCVQQLFQQNGFGCVKYLEKAVQILKKSNQLIRIKYSSLNLKDKDDIKQLIELKNKSEELKKIYELNWQYQFDFQSIYAKIENSLQNIQQSIKHCFIYETIHILNLKKIYKDFENDKDKISLIIHQNLQQYRQKMQRIIQSARQDSKKESINLYNDYAFVYINKLDQLLKDYEQLKQFLKPQIIKQYFITKEYFIMQIKDFQIEERLKNTYKMVKENIIYFHKRLPKQYSKLLSSMKKVESIIDKVAQNSAYSDFYKQIEVEQVDGKDYHGTKFTQRLQYFKQKSQKFVKEVLSNNMNYQQIIKNTDFIDVYNNLSPKQKQQTDDKLNKVVQVKKKQFQDSSRKSDQERTSIEEGLKVFAQNLPYEKKGLFNDKIDKIKERLKQGQQTEIKNMQTQLEKLNIFDYASRIQNLSNVKFKKQLRKNIVYKLKTLRNTINSKKTLEQSFSQYLNHFGQQNSGSIQEIKYKNQLDDLFSNQEQIILKRLIQKIQQLASYIQVQFARCQQEQLRYFDQICQQLIKIYFLVLHDNSSGFCLDLRKKILSIEEEYISKINQKIQRSISTDIDIRSNSTNSPQRSIIEWKLFITFINIFIRQSQSTMRKNIKETQFARETNRKLKKIKSENIIITRLTNKFKELFAQIQKVDFYDDQIKVLNQKALEEKLQQRLLTPLKMISACEYIYNNHLVQKTQDKFSKENLLQLVQKRWSSFIETSKKQFQNALNQPQQQISQKITVLERLTSIIAEKKLTIIDKELKSKQDLQAFIETKINQVREKLKLIINQAEQIAKKNKKSLEKYQKAIRQLAPQINKIQQQKNAKIQSLQKQIQRTNDLEAKQNLKLNFQNIGSFSNEKKQGVKAPKYNQYIKQKKMNEQQLKEIANKAVKYLIIMEKIIQSVSYKSKNISKMLAKFLQDISKKHKSINKIIFDELKASNNNYAANIADDPEIFKAQAAAEFKKKTQKQGIQYIIDNCPEIKKNQRLVIDVRNFFNQYKDKYNQIIRRFLVNPAQQQINNVVKQLRDLKEKNEAQIDDNTHTAEVIAQIFAIWSMTKIDLSNEDNLSNDFQPHPAQIVAIFLLIANSSSVKTIKNSFVEVLTGQGKSIVLAGVCIFLALKGYYAYCACYSQYLSTRDEKDFKVLFDMLEVSSNIKYGTFNQHCEGIINQSSTNKLRKGKNKSFRDHVKGVINSSSIQKDTKEYFSKIFDKDYHKVSKKVLIIDEVDVFFNQNFFGRLYCPSVSLDDDETKKLIEYIWRVTKASRENDKVNKIDSLTIQKSEQFKRVIRKYPSQIQILLKDQVIGMLQAVYNYQHQYIIHKDSIKYRENDSITDQISYGYKTVFANCYQHQKKTISQISYNQALKMTLSIAPFSYSQLPIFFQTILGISGTVSSISAYKKDVLRKKYGIQQIYRIPSVYGVSKRTDDNFSIVQNHALYDKIVEHTKKVSETETARPIALFFKTIKDVTHFYNSPQFKQFTKNTTILTEQTDHQSRDTIIKRVGQRGKITILTESFARGTDFKMYDKKINEIGGLHVIQTFISSDLSQYIQTRGRTARQGNKGSFEVLVNHNELEKFSMVGTTNEEFQKKMKEAWTKKDNSESKQLQQRVVKASKKHQKTQAIFKRSPSHKDIIQFIFLQNRFSQIKKNHIRTLIGVDGTCSMGYALRKVFDILEDIFTRTQSTLDKQMVLGSFETKIGIYRNYNSDHEEILEYSGYETDSQKLKQFLKNIRVKGGNGHQAVQVLLEHANKQRHIDQIVIIADARANTAEQTRRKRQSQGQRYWKKHGFPLTNEAVEVQRLIEKNIKIHTLYINQDSQLKKYFNDISARSGGLSSELRLNDENASEFLTGFLVKNILKLIGGEQKGQKLVQSYDKEFNALRL